MDSIVGLPLSSMFLIETMSILVFRDSTAALLDHCDPSIVV